MTRFGRCLMSALLLLGMLTIECQHVVAQSHSHSTKLTREEDTPRTTTEHRTLADTRTDWPTREKFLRVVSLRDYTTRWVLLGTVVLGTCAGMVGTFMLLRKRALVGDVVGHASLPGIAIAFIAMEAISPGSGKWLPGLLIGAFTSGVVGVICTVVIRRYTRIKEDATLAIVLSIFFGIGIALFTVIQNIPSGNQAGLNNFIYGAAYAIVETDVYVITGAAVVVLIICVGLFKEFSLLCFDEGYASAQGWPVTVLDIALMLLVVAVTVIGLQSVGLILVVALLIIPAAAARFWTDNLFQMTWISAMLGGLSSGTGVLASALFPSLPAGAVIVVLGSVVFLLSMFFGLRRGVVRRAYVHWRMRRRVGRQHVMRAFYEFIEIAVADTVTPTDLMKHEISFHQLLTMRSWSPKRLKLQLFIATLKRLVERLPSSRYRLTAKGAENAYHVVRNHRLWEMYLIQYADIAPTHVDRDADEIEHFLDPELIKELNSRLSQKYPQMEMPPSPHTLEQPLVSNS